MGTKPVLGEGGLKGASRLGIYNGNNYIAMRHRHHFLFLDELLSLLLENQGSLILIPDYDKTYQR